MTKDELIKAVALKSQINEAEAAQIINIFVDQIKTQLSRGEKVSIPGFGSFILSKRKAKTFVNPKTKTVHEIPERSLPTFKPGEALKKILKINS